MNGIVGFRKCTLTDEELIEKADKMIDSLYQSNADRDNILSRHIPARPDQDFDLVLGELIVRFKELVDKELKD